MAEARNINWIKNTAEYIRNNTKGKYEDADNWRANILDKLHDGEPLDADEAAFMANLLTFWQFEADFRDFYYEVRDRRIERAERNSRRNSGERSDRTDSRRERSRSYSRR